MKKVLSLLLCVIMCMSIFTATAGQVYALGEADKMLKVTNSGFNNDEITYTIKLAAGQTKVTGAIIKVKFDSDALEVVEGKAAGYYNADGDFINYVSGMYATGLAYDDPGVYSLAYINATGYSVGSDDVDLFTIKFRAISEERRKTTVDFRCAEFTTDDGNDDNDIKKITDGIQKICEPHTFHTLSMTEVTSTTDAIDGVKVIWDKSIGATSYEILRKEADAAEWASLEVVDGETTEYVDISAEPGIEYYYTVVAGNADGTTDYDETGLAGLSFGGVISVINTVPVEHAAKITWNAVPGAASYDVYRKLDVSDTWQKIISVTETEYVDESVTSCVLYNYKVCAVNGTHSSETICDPASFEFVDVPYTTVSNTFAGIEISFEEVPGAEKYIIEKKDSNGDFNVLVELTDESDVNYIDETVIPGIKYEYSIQAVAGDIVSLKKEFEITRLGTPTVNEIKNTEDGVVVTWSAVEDATSYGIYRKTAADSIWEKYTSVTSTSFVDKNVVSGTEYCYRVCAENETGHGDFEGDHAMTYIATPVITSVSAVDNGISVKWNAVSNATGYNVYRSVEGSVAWEYVDTVTETSFVDETVELGTYYEYAVSAVKDEFESVYGTNGVECMYFGAITSISATLENNIATITWNELEKATTYKVYRKTATDTLWEELATVTTNSYDDGSISGGVAYQYTIVAYNGNIAAATTAEPVQVKYLDIPESSVENVTNGIQITVKPVNGAEGYVIQKIVDGAFVEIKRLGANQTTFVDEDVVSGTSYIYSVYATSTGADSLAYETDSITRIGMTNISAMSNTAQGITLTWAPVDGAASYNVYRIDESKSEWELVDNVLETSFTDETALSGTKYTYTVKAVAIDGSLGVLDSTGRAIMCVGMPKIVKLANTTAGVSVTWNVVPGATSYRVYRRISTSTSWVFLGNTSANTFVDNKSLVSGTTYNYTVIAVNGVFSDFDKVGPAINYLATPTLTKVANHANGVSVTWNAVPGAKTYRVYRKVGGATAWSYVGVTTATTFVDKNVVNGLYYTYTVIAANTSFSDFNKTGRYVKYVAAPVLTGIANNTNGIYFKWNAVGGATAYRVYRRLGNSTTWTYLGVTKNTYFTDTKVVNSNGYYYYYTVIAVAGYYSACNTVGIGIKRLATPVLKSATSNKTGITVKWNPIYGSAGYYVYRKTAGTGWSLVGTVYGVNNAAFVDKTARKGVTYTYTVRAFYGKTLSYFNTYGISCKDLY